MRKVIVLSILLTPMLSFKASAQEEVQVKAYFVGMEENLYVFMDEYEEEITFAACDKMVLKKYDLNGKEVVGEFFAITYIVLEDSEFEQKIIKLEPAEPEVIDDDWE